MRRRPRRRLLEPVGHVHVRVVRASNIRNVGPQRAHLMHVLWACHVELDKGKLLPEGVVLLGTAGSDKLGQANARGA